MTRVRCAIKCRNLVEWNPTDWVSEHVLVTVVTVCREKVCLVFIIVLGMCVTVIQVGSNMTGTDVYVNKLHCAAAVRP